MPIGKLETEIMRAVSLRQAAGELRSDYLVRVLQAGQELKMPQWRALSPEAQRWYNAGITTYNIHRKPEEIPEFDADLDVLERATLEPAPEPEEAAEEEAENVADAGNVADAEDEEEDLLLDDDDIPDEENEVLDDAEPEEFVPVKPVAKPTAKVLQMAKKPKPAPKPAAKPTRRPASKPVPKPSSKPSRRSALEEPVELDEAVLSALEEEEVEVSMPPKPSVPGAATMVKRLLIKNPDITNAELQERLRGASIFVTPIAVSTIRSEFRHSLRVLQESGFCPEIVAFL